MPIKLGSATGNTLATFPLARQKGEHYVPIVDKTEDGIVYAHAVQTILVEPQALYELWRDIESAPLWQEHIVSVKVNDEKTSTWTLGNPEDPKGKRIEYTSEIVEDVPGKVLSWKSITEGIYESGKVTFAPHPAGRGTIVTLTEQLKVPGGILGNAVGSIVERGPRQTVIEDLRHFKEMAEAGAIPSVKGQPHGPRGLTGKTKEWMYGETNPTPPGTSDVA